MTLINCTECGKQISLDAKSCPECGKPNKNTKLTFNKVLLVLAFSAIGIGITILFVSFVWHVIKSAF